MKNTQTKQNIIQTAFDKLSPPPSRQSLLELIRWLDLECSETQPESLPVQILARCVVAVGYELIKKLDQSNIKATLAAAEIYILNPTEKNFDVYQNAATDSYPFGPGDGCFNIKELGYPSCMPGSGCKSGAGTLLSVATELGIEVTMKKIHEMLLPWLQKILIENEL